MKKLLSLVIAVSLTISANVVVFAENKINVILNGSKIEFDAAPEIVNDRTFVPLRAIAESLDSTVTWVEETKSINITKDNVTTILSIDNTEVKTQSDNETTSTTLEAAPYIKDDRTMVPIRFISEAFGMNVNWDGDTQTINIESNISPTAALVDNSISATKIDNSKISYYTDFPTVPDFGACFGYKKTDNKEYLFYSGTTAEDRLGYTNLLESLGFKKVDEMVTSEVESYGYEKDNITVVTGLYHIANMENVYGVNIAKKAEDFTGDIKFYKDHSTVPDIGVLDGLLLSDTLKIATNITNYIYIVSDSRALENVLIQYSRILKDQGFQAYYQSISSAIFVNKDTKNTIMIEPSINENKNILLCISVKDYIAQ